MSSVSECVLVSDFENDLVDSCIIINISGKIKDKKVHVAYTAKPVTMVYHDMPYICPYSF